MDLISKIRNMESAAKHAHYADDRNLFWSLVRNISEYADYYEGQSDMRGIVRQCLVSLDNLYELAGTRTS